jgi:ABC-type Zn uptake system ZnuABC Zn-binding protein ZnuA
VPVRASRLSVAAVAFVVCTFGCTDDDRPPTVVASNDIVAAVATAVLGEDAAVEVQPGAADSVDAMLLDQLAPIPFGEGAQWLGPPPPSGDAPAIGTPDPAFWLDPDRVVQAARSIAQNAELDETARQRTDERLAALRETMRRADEEVQGLLLDLPPERRVVLTDNIRLGYLAERYGLQIGPTEGAGPLRDLDLDHLGPPGSPTATLDGLIVEVARRVALPES